MLRFYEIILMDVQVRCFTRTYTCKDIIPLASREPANASLARGSSSKLTSKNEDN